MKNTLKSTILVVIALGLACGDGDDSAVSTSGVTLTGTVSAPVSASISSASLSKASMPVPNGTVTAMTPSGTTLGTASIADGAFSIIVDPNALDATTQVVLVSTIGEQEGAPKLSNFADCSGKVAGDSVNSGETATGTTLSVQQVYYNIGADCTPESLTSACASAIVADTINPIAMYKAFLNEFTSSGTTTPGADTLGNAYQALLVAYTSAFAAGADTPALNPTFSQINSALAGGSVLNTWKGTSSALSAIDMSTVISNIQAAISAMPKMVNDATTLAKIEEAGTSGWSALAEFFSAQTSASDVSGMSNEPEIYQQYITQKMTSYIAGDATAFTSLTSASAAQSLAKMASGCDVSDLTGKYDELEKIMDAQKEKFATLQANETTSFAESLCNQMKAADTTTELAMLKADPSTFAGKLFDKPDIFTGTSGQATAGNQYVAYVQNETAFKAGASCNNNSDCSGLAGICSPDFHFCMEPCSINCEMGAQCGTNNQCKSGICSSAGSCTWGTGSDPLVGVLAANGSTCTSNAQCQSNSCTSSGTCAAPVPAGSVPFAGFYKKNAGATCVTAINIDGMPGSTKISFMPNDTTNVVANTFFGGNITLSGAGPFSIVDGSIQATTAPSGAMGTLRCDGTAGSTTLSLAGSTLTGTCKLTATQGSFNLATCTINHTKQ